MQAFLGEMCSYYYLYVLPFYNSNKTMYLNFIKAETLTASGIPARPVLTSYYKSRNFKNRARDSFNQYTSPDQTILCIDSRQNMYSQLLAGLVNRKKVIRLGAIFASAFLRAISFLKENWGNMCEDIRSGVLGSLITDSSCRSSMADILKSSDPKSAAEIQEICRRESWEGVLVALWPKTKYIEAVVTGTMAQYIPSLEYYTAGKIPLVGTMYASSESYFGVNLKPLCKVEEVAFTLIPNTDDGPVDEEDKVEKEKLVDTADLKIGLCRYRVGDVVQVVGFSNKAPQMRFVCRRNVVLSIDADKTTEEDLHNSITKAKDMLNGAHLVEYTSYPDTSTLPGHYVLFWEMASDTTCIESGILENCCLVRSTGTKSSIYIYRRCRSHDKSIGALEIRLLKPGSFEALMDHFVTQGASINQYKTPRCIKTKDALDILNSSVTDSFLGKKRFSPKSRPKVLFSPARAD
ncbi:hypothetical protein MKW98_015255, partial [Papaver atlanticum]